MKQIIEKLASKELRFGCRVKYKNEEWMIVFEHEKNIILLELESLDRELFDKREMEDVGKFEILGHPVYKHHVEEAYLKDNHLSDDLLKLTELWQPLGLTKSLQEIEEASGYEKVWISDPQDCYTERLKDPNARALESFLNQIL